MAQDESGGAAACEQRFTSGLPKPTTAPCGSLTHLACPRLSRERCSRPLDTITASDAPDSFRGVPDPAQLRPEPMAGALRTGYDPSFPAMGGGMKKRSRAGGEPAKARRRKSVTLKHRNAPTVTRSRPSSMGGKDKKIALLTRERDEALARQIATADILRIISQSPTDVRPVFESIVLTAARLLRCDLVFVLLCDGATYRHAAVASPEGPFADPGPTNFPIDPGANFPSRAITDKKCCTCRTGRASTCPSTSAISIRCSG